MEPLDEGGSRSMIQSLTWWEIALAMAIALLATVETISMCIARGRGLTRATGRLIAHALVLVSICVYGWLALDWSRSLEQAVHLTNYNEVPTANWPYLVLAVVIAMVISWELISHLRALKAGLTRNISRIVSRGVMLILLAVMIGISEVRWQLYLDELKAFGSAPPPSATTPIAR